MTQSTPAMTSADVREALGSVDLSKSVERKIADRMRDAANVPRMVRAEEIATVAVEAVFAALASTPATVNVTRTGEFRCHSCKSISVGVVAPARCPECRCRDFSALPPAPVNVDQLREALEGARLLFANGIMVSAAKSAADAEQVAAVLDQIDAALAAANVDQMRGARVARYEAALGLIAKRGGAWAKEAREALA